MPLGWDSFWLSAGSQTEISPLMVCGYWLLLTGSFKRCFLSTIWCLYPSGSWICMGEGGGTSAEGGGLDPGAGLLRALIAQWCCMVDEMLWWSPNVAPWLGLCLAPCAGLGSTAAHVRGMKNRSCNCQCWQHDPMSFTSCSEPDCGVMGRSRSDGKTRGLLAVAAGSSWKLSLVRRRCAACLEAYLGSVGIWYCSS